MKNVSNAFEDLKCQITPYNLLPTHQTPWHKINQVMYKQLYFKRNCDAMKA